MQMREETTRGKAFRVTTSVFLYAVMGFYLLLLLLLLFGKRELGTFRSVNLIPFQEIGGYLIWGEDARRVFGLGNVVGNIVIFIPLGLYFSLLNRKGKLLYNTLLVLAVSVGAEVLQYVLQVGASDIDDVILNTLGGFLGVAVFWGLQALCKERVRTVVAWVAPIGGGL